MGIIVVNNGNWRIANDIREQRIKRIGRVGRQNNIASPTLIIKGFIHGPHADGLVDIPGGRRKNQWGSVDDAALRMEWGRRRHSGGDGEGKGNVAQRAACQTDGIYGRAAGRRGRRVFLNRGRRWPGERNTGLIVVGDSNGGFRGCAQGSGRRRIQAHQESFLRFGWRRRADGRVFIDFIIDNGEGNRFDASLIGSPGDLLRAGKGEIFALNGRAFHKREINRHGAAALTGHFHIQIDDTGALIHGCRISGRQVDNRRRVIVKNLHRRGIVLHHDAGRVGKNDHAKNFRLRRVVAFVYQIIQNIDGDRFAAGSARLPGDTDREMVKVAQIAITNGGVGFQSAVLRGHIDPGFRAGRAGHGHGNGD